MAKINDTTTFPNTNPAFDDFVIGTDVSDTGNSADGEVVTFTFDAIRDLMALSNTWHPYDRTTISGSEDGVIYDSAVDGSVSTIESPDFESGYEYMFRFDRVGASSTGGTLRYEMYVDGTASYSSVYTLSRALTSTRFAYGDLIIPKPKASLYAHEAYSYLLDSTTIGYVSVTPERVSYNLASPFTVGKIRFSLSAQQFNSGKIYMFRRREGISA